MFLIPPPVSSRTGSLTNVTGWPAYSEAENCSANFSGTRWVLMKNLSMPMSSKWSSAKVMSGFWKMGTSGFGNSSVKGLSRVPNPAPRTNACLIGPMALNIPHAGGNRLARQRFAMEELRLLSPPAFGRGGDCSDLRCVIAKFDARNATVQSVHFVSPGRANLYRCETLSPNEMQSLRSDDGTFENERGSFQQGHRHPGVLPGQRH